MLVLIVALLVGPTSGLTPRKKSQHYLFRICNLHRKKLVKSLIVTKNTHTHSLLQRIFQPAVFSREKLKILKKNNNTGHHTLVETWGNDWKTEWPTSSVFYGVRRHNGGVAAPKVLPYCGQAGYVRCTGGADSATRAVCWPSSSWPLPPVVGSRMVLVWTKCA